MTDPHRAQLDQIRRAIAALPDRPREVFTLHVVEALDFGAISRQLGLSLAEVEQGLADAIYLIDKNLRRQERGGIP
jgi:DNA-directed RNA polymerase specialized sigma24 family protein